MKQPIWIEAIFIVKRTLNAKKPNVRLDLSECGFIITTTEKNIKKNAKETEMCIRDRMGLIIIVLFYKSAKENNDSSFRWMWLTIVLSFAFYIPVVLLSLIHI